MHCLKKVNNIISTDTSGKKSDYNTNINQIEKKNTDHNHDKHVTAQEFNKFRKFYTKIETNKFDIADVVKKMGF